jgi:corrinoid protein of di/trimethylamine methyltransferase
LKEEILKGLSDSVVDMDEVRAAEYANKAVAEGLDAYEAIDKGLAAGMQRAGDLFDSEDYFIPEILLCSDALNAGVDILKPHIKVDKNAKDKKKIVIGVIQGDTHDIGKNLVRILAETAQYEIFDIGRDVPAGVFVDTAIKTNADIIAISTLMTTTMIGMPKVIEILKEKNIRDKFKVIIGGGPISQFYANQIGADGYGANASEALKLIQRLVAQ